MPGDGERRLEATIHGRVQGVGFRYFVRQRATSLGLSGWVRNLRGGAVELVAEGPEEDIKKLLEAVREGPPMAWVERVDVAWKEPRGASVGFDVKHTI
ncbi:MAG: acylphosphatase [Armatimonadota bacterium]